MKFIPMKNCLGNIHKEPKTLLKKGLFYIVLFPIFLTSCQRKNTEESTPQKQRIEKTSSILALKDIQHPTLLKWQSYYQQQVDENFRLDKFEYNSTQTIPEINSNIAATFDTVFDPVYEPHLIYNPSKNQYIDLDSYWWSKKPNKEKTYNVDQEINWIDIEYKTKKRIAFRGASSRVEDALWINDQEILLLENNSEHTPIITHIKLDSQKAYIYTYPNVLKKKSDYSDYRLLNK